MEFIFVTRKNREVRRFVVVVSICIPMPEVRAVAILRERIGPEREVVSVRRR